MLCRRYDFLGKDTDKPDHANGTAAPGKSSDDRRHREHRSSKDRDRDRSDRHRDGDRHKDRDGRERREHRSDPRDHRSSRPRDERDHRSSRDERERYREDPRGQFKKPRTQEFLPRPPPPRLGHTSRMLILQQDNTAFMYTNDLCYCPSILSG